MTRIVESQRASVGSRGQSMTKEEYDRSVGCEDVGPGEAGLSEYQASLHSVRGNLGRLEETVVALIRQLEPVLSHNQAGVCPSDCCEKAENPPVSPLIADIDGVNRQVVLIRRMLESASERLVI